MLTLYLVLPWVKRVNERLIPWCRHHLYSLWNFTGLAWLILVQYHTIPRWQSAEHLEGYDMYRVFYKQQNQLYSTKETNGCRTLGILKEVWWLRKKNIKQNPAIFTSLPTHRVVADGMVPIRYQTSITIDWHKSRCHELTHWNPVTLDGNLDLSQHWLRQ